MFSHIDIEKFIQNNEIVIQGFKADMLRPASYCLTAGQKIYIAEKSKIDIKNAKTYPKYRELAFTDSFEFKPNKFIMIQTDERISVSQKIACLITTPSGLARLGINMLNSILVSPGYGTTEPLPLTIELVNISENTIIISPSFRICHLIFFQLESISNLNYDLNFGGQSNDSISSQFYKSWK